MSARPSAVVSPTKMNVFYIGVDNPVDISAPGVPAEHLRPSMTEAQLLRQPEEKEKYNGSYQRN